MSDQPVGNRFSTLALHAGTRTDAGAEMRAVRDVFARNDGAAPDLLPDGDGATRTVLEERVAALEGGSDAVATVSGAGAALVAFHALLGPGDEVVASHRLDPALVRLFTQAFSRFGWTVKWADPDRSESFVEALSDGTRAIVVESFAGDGTMTDLESIARVARRARLPLLVDNALATPFLVRPLERGADIVLHSSSAGLAGRGALGGIIVDGGTFDWAASSAYPALATPRRIFGGATAAEAFGNFAFAAVCRNAGLPLLAAPPGPIQAELMLCGIETLALRLARQSEAAFNVASHLLAHPAVSWVRYPGLAGDPNFSLARRCCEHGCGSGLAFGLAGGSEAAARFVDKLRLVAKGDGWSGTRTIAAHPARPADLSREYAAMAFGPEAVRLSVGLEHEADILADLDQALAS